VIKQALCHFKDKEPDLKEERLMVLENWLMMEQRVGTSTSVDEVKAKFPKRVKRRRKVVLPG
jgi:crooked neck